ncbi:MAG: tetratricopeptide (TPR) repeat protein [Candidatus Aldehydirespiratoraceae bacterium]
MRSTARQTTRHHDSSEIPILRQTRLLLAALLVTVVFVAAFARFGNTPEASAVNENAESEPNHDWLGTLSLSPLDVIELDISLTIDHTRAPLADVIEQFRQRISANPTDHVSQTLLASVVLSQAKEQADLDLYDEAETLVDQALHLTPPSIDAQLLKIRAVGARHDFSTAQQMAQAILSAAPDHLGAMTAIGDSHLALGDREIDASIFRTVTDAETNAGFTSRHSRIAFLHGDTAHAVDALHQASETPLRPSEASFYWFQLGFVLFAGGDVGGAAEAPERP